MKIKLVYVIDDLGLGGAQRQLTELVKALPRDRYAVEVVSLSAKKNAYEKPLREAGIPLTFIDHSGTWSWSTLFRVYGRLKDLKPDIVHTWLFTADLYGRLAAYLARVPHVICAFRSTIDDMPRHYRWVHRLLAHGTTSFTINAKMIRTGLVQELGLPSHKIHTIYNGIDVAGIPLTHSNGHYDQEWQIPSGARIVMMVARMAPPKDHRTFLKAARKVAKQMPETYFVLAGDGPLRGRVEGWVSEWGLRERTRILGARHDVLQFLHQASVIVLSTHFEGCSNVILEAMAASKPVVATNVGGNAELVVHGQTGWTVPREDADALAEAIVNLLSDEEGAKRMGANGRTRVEKNFSLQAMVRETQAFYDRTLSNGKRIRSNGK